MSMPDAGGPLLLIGVIGGQLAGEEALGLAYAVGHAIGERGHVLLTGGREGVMREASRGAKEAGGLTVAVAPGEDLADVNEYVDIPIITGLGFARNAVIARSANALIAIDGAYGTLSEIAFGLIAGTPIIGLGTWELRSPTGEEPPIIRVEAPADAVDAAISLARVHPRGPRGGPQSGE